MLDFKNSKPPNPTWHEFGCGAHVMLFSRNLIDVTGKQVHKWWIHIYADPSVPHHPKSSCRCPSLKSFRDINKQIDTICRIWKKHISTIHLQASWLIHPQVSPISQLFRQGVGMSLVIRLATGSTMAACTCTPWWGSSPETWVFQVSKNKAARHGWFSEKWVLKVGESDTWSKI